MKDDPVLLRMLNTRRLPPANLDDVAQYQGTPWLTGLASFCAVVGTLIGCVALIVLPGYRHRGFPAYLPMLLILASMSRSMPLCRSFGCAGAGPRVSPARSAAASCSRSRRC